MFIVGMIQGVGWMTFSSCPDVVADYYGFSNPQASIDMLLNWGPIMYLPMAPAVGWLTARRMESVWAVVFLGSLLTAVGLLVRLVPSYFPEQIPPSSSLAHAIVHFGQALNGLAGPTNCVTPSLLAATWFPPGERTLATSAVFAIQTAAPAVGFLMALWVTTSNGLVNLMVAEAVWAVLAVCLWLLVPRKPRCPPSASQQQLSVRGGTRHSLPMRRWVSASAVFLASGLAVGCFQTWTSTLPTQLEGVLSQGMLKWFAVISNLASVAGNFFAGPLTEHFGLQTSLCRVVIVALVVQLLGYLGFALLLPNSPVRLMDTSPGGALVAMLLVASAAEGILSPIIYELGAELTYPYSESLSGGVYSWLLNFYGLVLLAVFPIIPVAMDSFAMAGAAVVSLLGMLLVREEYPRRRVDEGNDCASELSAEASAEAALVAAPCSA
eukprot:TRINITY_DN19775_c0_g1_i1.p1 TRINITY_DN19775_c0_g1~~TRINITY_DN19775_c0_g1_i1.p1  ORF type:complete len:474 (-),score=94.15 TRINITY_DN19775_c0_g1_i1:360-1673(-)